MPDLAKLKLRPLYKVEYGQKMNRRCFVFKGSILHKGWDSKLEVMLTAFIEGLLNVCNLFLVVRRGN